MDYRTILGLTYGDFEVSASVEQQIVMVEDTLEDTTLVLEAEEVDQLIEALREAKYELG